MNLLQLQKGSKHFGSKILFDGASFSINAGEHVGVIGPNGAGKSTLFKILVGQLDLDSGEIVKSQQLRVGYLEQESEWRLDQTSEQYLQENCTKPLWELKQIGGGLGLTETHFQTPLQNLSGGYRMRMKLLYLIGREPNLMLLDEPTNFLDLESVLALENFLQSYEGAFLLISHDREFLRRTTEATLEVEAGDITKFPGHIDDYFEQKTMLRGVLEAQAANQDLKRKHLQDFIDRFGAKATKARQAQSRMKQLEKMEAVEIKDLPVRAKIKIPAPVHTGKESLSLSAADLGYGGSAILRDVELRLERGVHLGVVGFNGAGKSTLLKSLAGALPLLKGERKLGFQVTLSHFSQHSAEQLDLNDIVIDALEKAAHLDMPRQSLLNVAGSLLFSGDDLQKKIRVLSGGEKSRVALGQVLLKRSPLLLLDEPTNHLDFETVETLTEALRDYEGTVVVVSHDRSFIRRVSSQILEIRDGRVEKYPGTYDDYVWSLQKGALKERASAIPAATETPASSRQADPGPRPNYRDESKRLNAAIRQYQGEISKSEVRLKKLSEVQIALTAKLVSSQGTEAQAVSKELAWCSRDIAAEEEKMLASMEALEGVKSDLERLKS